jgi:multisubunit Na+/H+ antiporter MnhC subunit
MSKQRQAGRRENSVPGPGRLDISQHTKAADPGVQALALTDVSVESAVTAPFAARAHEKFGALDPHDLVEFKG